MLFLFIVFIMMPANENSSPTVHQCWYNTLTQTGICGDMYGRITPEWKSECMETVAKVCELKDRI